MRKLFYTLGTIAAVAFALTSCERQEISNPDDNLVTITLKADKAGIDTKTAADEGDKVVSYFWTAEDEDNMKLFVVGLDDKGKETFTVVESAVLSISDDNKILSITATVPANSVVRAVLSSDWTTSTKPKVSAIQNPLVDNFDPNADILVSDDVTVSGLNEELLTFRRPVTVNKMTLKNLVAGEKVNKVTISSETTDLTGYYEYESATMSGQNNEITLKYNDVEVGSTKEFPVYFVAMPNTGHTLTVVVKTDQNTYSKTFGNGTIDFNLGEFTKFGVNLSGCAVDESDYSGEWVIGGANDKSALAAIAYTSGNFYPVLNVLSIEDDVVTVATGSSSSLKMTVTRVTEGDNAGLYTIVDANGKYLSATGGLNSSGNPENFMTGLTAPDATTSYWSIEENTDGTFNIVAENVADNLAKSMRVNFSSPRVSCYTMNSTQAKVTLYPFDKVVEEEEEEIVNTSTLENPYTPAEANELAQKLGTKTLEGVYVAGIVSKVASIDITQYYNANYYISADGTDTDAFYVFRGKYIDGADFTSADQLNVGDKVTVCGTLKLYNNKTPELDAGSSIVAYEVPQSYSITVNSSENGTVTASAETATEGTKISLTVTPAAGYVLDALTVTDAENANVAVADNVFSMPASDVTVSATFKERELEYPVTDVLNVKTMGITAATYANWSGLTFSSNAVYAGNSMVGNSAIQMRSTGNSGIVTTSSGGKATKVIITWSSSTAEGRVVNVYGKSVAYSSSADLYGSDAGELLGTIECGTSTELTIEGDYEFIGLRSDSKALYLDEIDITWDK